MTQFVYSMTQCLYSMTIFLYSMAHFVYHWNSSHVKQYSCLFMEKPETTSPWIFLPGAFHFQKITYLTRTFQRQGSPWHSWTSTIIWEFMLLFLLIATVRGVFLDPGEMQISFTPNLLSMLTKYSAAAILRLIDFFILKERQYWL